MSYYFGCSSCILLGGIISHSHAIYYLWCNQWWARHLHLQNLIRCSMMMIAIKSQQRLDPQLIGNRIFQKSHSNWAPPAPTPKPWDIFCSTKNRNLLVAIFDKRIPTVCTKMISTKNHPDISKTKLIALFLII